LIMLNKFVPHQEEQPVSSARQELGALRRGQVWFTLGIGAIGFGGLFAVFSYIAPTLTQVTGLGESWVPIALAVMGAGMIVGNIAGGWLADRALVKSIGGVLVWTMLVLAIFPWMAGNTWTMMLNIFLIGTGLALGPVLQIRLMDVAADAQTLAASLNHSAFNMANALGAWLGGVAITAGCLACHCCTCGDWLRRRARRKGVSARDVNRGRSRRQRPGDHPSAWKGISSGLSRISPNVS
jgi:DHA1 family inner membrane transport protein